MPIGEVKISLYSSTNWFTYLYYIEGPLEKALAVPVVFFAVFVEKGLTQ
jgi:hypothetical protein